jgi:hypothetical protein
MLPRHGSSPNQQSHIFVDQAARCTAVAWSVDPLFAVRTIDFSSRIKFAPLRVAKNAPNARRCNNHGLKLRRNRNRLLWSHKVCQFSPVVQHRMPESTAEQVLSRLYSLWITQFSGSQDVLKCVVFQDDQRQLACEVHKSKLLMSNPCERRRSDTLTSPQTVI